MTLTSNGPPRLVFMLTVSQGLVPELFQAILSVKLKGIKGSRKWTGTALMSAMSSLAQRIPPAAILVSIMYGWQYSSVIVY